MLASLPLDVELKSRLFLLLVFPERDVLAAHDLRTMRKERAVHRVRRIHEKSS
jgi:hypothetical protein